MNFNKEYSYFEGLVIEEFKYLCFHESDINPDEDYLSLSISKPKDCKDYVFSLENSQMKPHRYYENISLYYSFKPYDKEFYDRYKYSKVFNLYIILQTSAVFLYHEGIKKNCPNLEFLQISICDNKIRFYSRLTDGTERRFEKSV